MKYVQFLCIDFVFVLQSYYSRCAIAEDKYKLFCINHNLENTYAWRTIFEWHRIFELHITNIIDFKFPH
jgi:hypothetical protein